MKWDMEDMGAVMFLPVVFCLHIVLICLGFFTGELLESRGLQQVVLMHALAQKDTSCARACMPACLPVRLSASS